MFEKEPEDIFAGTEPAKPEALRPAGALSPTVPGRPGAPAQVGATPEETGEGPAPRSKKFLILIAVVLLVILGGGGYLAWKQFFPAPAAEPVPTIPLAPANVNLPAEEPVEEAAPVLPATLCGNNLCEEGEDSETCPADCPLPPPPPVASPDTDGDGLTDDEEALLGTDPAIIDTDSDGLTDNEEVNTYNTNPLNPDTDGDSYPDGDEVRNGYNPNGEGKLLELPQQ